MAHNMSHPQPPVWHRIHKCCRARRHRRFAAADRPGNARVGRVKTTPLRCAVRQSAWKAAQAYGAARRRAGTAKRSVLSIACRVCCWTDKSCHAEHLRYSYSRLCSAVRVASRHVLVCSHFSGKSVCHVHLTRRRVSEAECPRKGDAYCTSMLVSMGVREAELWRIYI